MLGTECESHLLYWFSIWKNNSWLYITCMQCTHLCRGSIAIVFWCHGETFIHFSKISVNTVLLSNKFLFYWVRSGNFSWQLLSIACIYKLLKPMCWGQREAGRKGREEEKGRGGRKEGKGERKGGEGMGGRLWGDREGGREGGREEESKKGKKMKKEKEMCG